MTTTIDLAPIEAQLNYLMGQIQTIQVDVPGWLTPIPTAIAEAAATRDALHDEWVNIEDTAQGCLHAIRAAQTADDRAVREAARAGKPLPRKKSDEEKLRRQAVYDLELAHAAYSRLSAANTAVKEALEAAAPEIDQPTIETSKAELNNYNTHLAEARRVASDAGDAFSRAVRPLVFVSHLESVRSNVQFTAGADPNIQVTAAHMAAGHVHNTHKMLESRGIVGAEASA